MYVYVCVSHRVIAWVGEMVLHSRRFHRLQYNTRIPETGVEMTTGAALVPSAAKIQPVLIYILLQAVIDGCFPWSGGENYVWIRFYPLP